MFSSPQERTRRTKKLPVSPNAAHEYAAEECEEEVRRGARPARMY
ncbi:MAG: hypothetical protein ACLSVD_18200 [Eggerthellaceae bacterium]